LANVAVDVSNVGNWLILK